MLEKVTDALFRLQFRLADTHPLMKCTVAGGLTAVALVEGLQGSNEMAPYMRVTMDCFFYGFGSAAGGCFYDLFMPPPRLTLLEAAFCVATTIVPALGGPIVGVLIESAKTLPYVP